MSERTDLDALAALFSQAPADQAGEGWGFPIRLPLTSGESLSLFASEPAWLSRFDADDLGVVLVDSQGIVRARWGLANHLDLLAIQNSLLSTDLGLLIQSALRGSPGSLYLDGFRYFSSPLDRESGFPHMLLIVSNASEEQAIRRQAERNYKAAELLRQVGKALNMNQNLGPLCQAAVHAIASAAELSATLLWVREDETGPMELRASIGANRNGITMLQMLHGDGQVTCLAELVASTRREMRLRSVHDNVMTAQIEAQCCYLKPGSLHAMPLTIGDKVIGVLELIARESDTEFHDQHDLYKTIGEHLALAINTTISLEQAENLAKFDPLTGIDNHREMQDFLAQRVTESARTGQRIGLIMLDVDHFRALNEEEGHDLGDFALRQVAKVLKEAIRPYDRAARYGGEEFVVIMPGSSMATTLQVAKRIRKRLEEIPIVTASGVDRHITASLGCAVFPDSARDAAGLLRAADAAMFEAKRAGRNQVKAFEGEVTTETRSANVDFDAIAAWLEPEDEAASDQLIRATDDLISPVSEQMRLSKNQQTILRGMLKLYPRVRRAQLAHDRETLKEMEKQSDLRAVMPALGAWEERFDGQGPRGLSGARLPLLTRIAQVLVSVAENGARELEQDRSRFDPEIVAIVQSERRAA